ncbi:MAG: hypothetical protein ACM34K_00595 [Bacillota bacterium]
MDAIFGIIIIYTALSVLYLQLKTGTAYLLSNRTPIIYLRKDKPKQYWSTLVYQLFLFGLISFAIDFGQILHFNFEKYFAVGTIIVFLTWFQVFCYYYYNRLKKK